VKENKAKAKNDFEQTIQNLNKAIETKDKKFETEQKQKDLIQ